MNRSHPKLLVVLIVVLALAVSALAGLEGFDPDGWTWDGVPTSSGLTSGS